MAFKINWIWNWYNIILGINLEYIRRGINLEINNVCYISICDIINSNILEMRDEEDKYGDLYEDGIDEQPKPKTNGGTTVED